jgi:SAM-dependent methyltransferase
MSSVCPACESPQNRHFASIPDLLYEMTSEEFVYRRCLDCGAIYLNNPPRAEDMGKYYPDIYGPHHRQSRGGKAQRGILSLAAQKMWGRLAALYPFYLRRSRFFSTIASGDLFVDYGCGAGESLDLARRFGARTCGIDFAQSVVEDLQQRGHMGLLATKDWTNAVLEAGGAMRIRLNHSLEHVHEPQALIDDVAKIAKPGCLLHIGVPNPQGLSAHLFGKSWGGLEAPRHLVMLSAGTIRRMLKRAGFAVTAISTEPSATDFARSVAVLGWRCGLLHKKSSIINFNERAWSWLPGLPLIMAAPLVGRGDRIHVFARRERAA